MTEFSELTNLELQEVSLVDQGANPGAHILFMKRKGTEMNLEQLQKRLTEVEAENASLKADVSKSAKLEEIEKKLGEADKAAADLKSEITKRDEEIAKRDAEITKRDEEIAKLKASVEDEKLRSEVEKSYPLTKGTTEEKMAVLKSVRAIADEAVRKSLIDSMNAAEETLKKMASEKGTSEEPVTKGAQDKLDALAKAEMEKNPKISKQQAFAKAYSTPEGKKLLAEIRN